MPEFCRAESRSASSGIAVRRSVSSTVLAIGSPGFVALVGGEGARSAVNSRRVVCRHARSRKQG
ncbi:hypothetical protein A5650_02835 [Mycobacterium sp. 1164985.4]|nr:hypothetical protein A5650_02835 [Mycobacterium sp. 1164985.4]